MRAFTALLLMLACLAARGHELRIAEPSTGLAFSDAEVNRSAEAARARLLQDMERAGQRGCAAYCDVIARVWAALLPVLERQQALDAPTLRVVVGTGAQVDAVSFPDGTIVISEAFIRRMELDDSQIAFVLAHEASHALLQHERQSLTSMLAVMPAAVRRSPRDVYTELEFRYFAMSDLLSVVFHQIEFEADEIGFQLAALAGFPPAAQLGFMRKLALADPAGTPRVMHPDAPARLRRLDALLPLARRLWEAGRQ